MENFNAAMEAGTSGPVKMWMNWMMLVFAASIIFVWKYAAARWALLVLILTGVGAVIVWNTTQNIHLLGIVHLVLWLPLMIYMWKRTLSKAAPTQPPSTYERAYRFWAILLVATIFVSLLFDVRDIYLVVTGVR